MKRVTLASGIALDVLDTGPADAPAILFLHGFPEDHRTWRHQIAHLSGRFRCIAPDLRGYRGSSKPQDVADYAPEKLVTDVFQLADSLGLGNFTVAGHDWGGALAWLVATLGQDIRVNRAIIANAPHPALFQALQWTDPVQRAASQYIRTFRDPANDALVRAQGLGPLLVKAFGGSGFDRLSPEERARVLALATDPDLREARLADRSDSATAFAMLNWYRASPIDVPPLDAPYGLGEGRELRPLPPLAIPTLVVWAEDDIALPPANLAGLEHHVRDLTVVRVPGCGHFVTWQAPDAVNAAIDAFLAR